MMKMLEVEPFTGIFIPDFFVLDGLNYTNFPIQKRKNTKVVTVLVEAGLIILYTGSIYMGMRTKVPGKILSPRNQ